MAEEDPDRLPDASVARKQLDPGSESESGPESGSESELIARWLLEGTGVDNVERTSRLASLLARLAGLTE